MMNVDDSSMNPADNSSMNPAVCVRIGNRCATHACAMVRGVRKRVKWTKVKHGFTNRLRAEIFWKCSLSAN